MVTSFSISPNRVFQRVEMDDSGFLEFSGNLTFGRLALFLQTFTIQLSSPAKMSFSLLTRMLLRESDRYISKGYQEIDVHKAGKKETHFLSVHISTSGRNREDPSLIA
ncbi:hypothetical protein L6164_025750 [Bauhinia variegata]|uniref:Uncharacterized protein n=1 Tax=Bauhinia variegata TaxID=167791 RepID=A0ACB9M1D7_BAUVA|nr:hypothetical protein L6164_025750 [Bauhinia variegata]